MLRTWFIACVVLAVVARADGAAATEPIDKLRAEFESPPESAWPRTWWHWTRGAVTKPGITKDLEWMQRVGIAGFQLADVNFGGGQTVTPTVDFGTPEWLDAVRHAAAEADRLGLEMAIFSSPGWSMTGGPWVKPDQAMKRLVWSELQVAGPREFRGELPRPPSNYGSFQDLGANRSRESFYRDVRVLAFRAPVEQGKARVVPIAVTSSGGAIDTQKLSDDRYDAAVSIESPRDDGTAWVEYRYDAPITVRAITIAGEGGIPIGRVAVSDDGERFRTLVTLPGTQLYRQGRVRTFAIPAATGRVFRLEMSGAPLRPAETMSEASPQPAERYSLLEWHLDPTPRVHRWQEKAGFGHLFEYDTVATPSDVDLAAIQPDRVFDLTAQMTDDGVLQWDVPDGDWIVLRLGYSLTGARNRPATPAGSGLEVDKLSRRHTEEYYDAYTQPIAAALGPLYGRSLRFLLIDSWEAGQQNWTEDMIAEFTRRRGYDPTPYLPALTGRVVESGVASDRFLWDFRRTLADMFAENHYAVMTERAHRDGLGVYSEASGVSLEISEDTLLNKSKVDIPMGEFWVRDLHPRLMYLQDVRGAASAAHVYGKPIVAAEAFTGGGYESPFALKRVSDYWLAQGINRLVYHTSAHQPLDTLPGNTMVGTHLHRNITWAEQARPLNAYFARTCHLLQQGKPVVDLLYLLDEGAPSTPSIWGAGTRPAPPEGYDYDFINADALLHRVAVADDGRLELPDGMSYRVLVLFESRQMRPEVIQKLRELLLGGATLVGPRPLVSPSLSDQPGADRRVAELAEELWGDLNGTSRTIRRVGNGTIVWGRTLGDVLDRLSLPPDFESSAPLDAQFAWKHRRTNDADIYYVSNLTDRPVAVEARFRVAGRTAELWRPDTGSVCPASYRFEDSRTVVPLELERNETLFVVFGAETVEASRVVPTQRYVELAEVQGEWDVRFREELGAPDRVTMKELTFWSEHDLPAVRYYSGTATYSTTFDAPTEWFRPEKRLFIDFGDVRDVAEVIVNGASMGTVWRPPFRVDGTSALRPGENQIEVRVTNQWTNRIQRDRSAPQDERVFGELPPAFGRGPQEPEQSGLSGPVRILVEE